MATNRIAAVERPVAIVAEHEEEARFVVEDLIVQLIGALGERLGRGLAPIGKDPHERLHARLILEGVKPALDRTRAIDPAPIFIAIMLRELGGDRACGQRLAINR